MTPEFTEITRSAELLATLDVVELEILLARKICLDCARGSGYNHLLLARGVMAGLNRLASSGQLVLIGSSPRERMATSEFQPENDVDIQILPKCEPTRTGVTTWLNSMLNSMNQYQEPYTDGMITYTYYQFPNANKNVFFQVKTSTDSPAGLPNFALIVCNKPKAIPKDISTNAPVVEFGLPYLATEEKEWIPATQFDPQLTHGIFGIIDTKLKVIRVYRNSVEDRYVLPPPMEMQMALRILAKGFLEDCTFTTSDGITYNAVVTSAKTQRKLLECVDEADRNGYAFPLITDQSWNDLLPLFWPALDLFLLALYPDDYHNSESGFAPQFAKLYDQASAASVGFPLSAIILKVISGWNKKCNLRLASDKVLKALRSYDVNQKAAEMNQDEFIAYLQKKLKSVDHK